MGNYWGSGYFKIPGYWNPSYWAGSYGDTGTVRNLLIGVNPDTIETTIYNFSQAPDSNNTGAILNCGYTPSVNKATNNVMQESTLLGTINAGYMLQAFSASYVNDGGETIEAEIEFNRFDPALDSSGLHVRKRFLKLIFGDVNPLKLGLQVYYAITETEREAKVWKEVTQSGGDAGYIENGIGRWLYVKIVDNTQVSNLPCIGSITVEFQTLGNI